MESLNEHISRMIELFEAQHGVIKPLITEDEIVQPGRGKQEENKDILFDEDWSESLGLNNKLKTKIKAQNPNFDSQLSELKSHPAYKLLTNKLPSNDAMKMFFFQIIQSTRLIFLDQTLEFLRSFTKKRKLIKRLEEDPNYTGVDELYDWEANILPGKENVTKIPVEKKDEIEYQDIDIPLQVQGKTVYVDNSTEPDVSLNDAIDKWVNDAKSVIENIKLNNPNVYVELLKVDIASSCSRLRNTKGYSGKTWKQLSTDRAERVYKILVEKLQSIGVTVSPEIEKITRGGYNGDGSSGPDPAKKFLFDNTSIGENGLTNNMSYSTNGADQLYGPDSKRKIEINGINYGELLATQAQSHQYKFCFVLATLRIKSITKEITPPLQPISIYTKGYSLVLEPKYYQKPKKLKIKGLKGAYKSTSKFEKFFQMDRKEVYQKMEKCPVMH